MNTTTNQLIFLSWSGAVSENIALTLQEVLPKIFESVTPWMSTHSIDKGEVWVSKLMDGLERTDIGVICLTKTNINNPYMLFEAGALAKMRATSRVCTYLYNVTPDDLKRTPYEIFQHTQLEKSDTFKLLQSINQQLPRNLSDEQLTAIFESMWPGINRDLQRRIDKAMTSNINRRLNGSKPIKWIGVVGSGNVDHPLAEDIINVCHLLGRALARNGFGLVTAAWPLVDEEVTKAFCSELQSLRRKPENFITQIVRSDHAPTYPSHYNIGRTVYSHTAHTVWVDQAKVLDGTIIISGEGGALQTALWMRLAGKPVFPLAKTGGDAEKYFFGAKAFSYNKDIPGLSIDDFERLGKPVPASVDDLMELLLKWAQYAQ